MPSSQHPPPSRKTSAPWRSPSRPPPPSPRQPRPRLSPQPPSPSFPSPPRTRSGPSSTPRTFAKPTTPRKTPKPSPPTTPKPPPAPSPPPPAPAPSATEDALSLAAAKPTPTPGEIGIDALGNYGKAVGNAIGIRSEFYRKGGKEPLAVGEVRVQFVLDPQGRASDIRILSNTAGPVNAECARRAVLEAKIPPIPADRLAQLPGGRIRIVYSFTIYPSQ